MGQRHFETAKACRNGATLVELTIVLLILGILAAVAGPLFADALDAFRVESAASRIRQDLEYARDRANSTSVPQAIVFRTAEDDYRLPGAPGLDKRNEDYTVRLAESPYRVDLVLAEFGAPPDVTSTLTYSVHGHPDRAGTVVVRSGNHLETIPVDLFAVPCVLD